MYKVGDSVARWLLAMAEGKEPVPEGMRRVCFWCMVQIADEIDRCSGNGESVEAKKQEFRQRP